MEEKRLEVAVQEQNLSHEEVVQMTTDHDNLNRALEDLKHKKEEVQKTVMSLEVSLTNKASAAEELLDTYNVYLTRLNLFPPLQPPLPPADLTLELNLAATSPQHLIQGADIREVIRPTLSQVSELTRAERANYETQQLEIDNSVDKLKFECENLEEEVLSVERKVQVVEQQIDDLREASLFSPFDSYILICVQSEQRKAAAINAETSKFEREIQQARTAALEYGMEAKLRLQNLEFEYV